MPKLISRFAVDVFRFSFELVFIFVFSSANILAQETGPRINEFLALNSTGLTDEDSDFSDWIEIYNPTPAAIDLGGWSLTDDAENPQKWLLPSVTLAANAYLIVFASGKDRALPGQELHVNFRLSGEGEYLALADPAGNRFTEFDPVFPAQQADISFAYFQGDYLQSPTPTPGSENQVSGNHLLPPPDFSVQRGFFEQPFQVEIISGLSNAQIYYTTDGSAPTAINGTEYTAPLQIDSTTLLRAIVRKSANLTSKSTTHTYLFLDDVINQPDNPAGYPAEWGPYATLTGNAIADYGMDPEIAQDPLYSASIKEALLSLPTLSLVTDQDNFFSHSTDPDSGGIYIYTRAPDVSPTHPSALGDGWGYSLVSVEKNPTGDPGDAAYWRASYDIHGSPGQDDELTTSVDERTETIPERFALGQNYPNPFNPTTVISYTIANAGFVTLKIYDILGREVRRLVNEKQATGTYTVNFSAKRLPSGVYFYRLNVGEEFVQTRKMLLMR